MPYLGVTPAAEFTSKDLNGEELILDADADTTITADTDDTIDIRIAGADDFQFTANTFTAQSGSTIAAQALTVADTATLSADFGTTETGALYISNIGTATTNDISPIAFTTRSSNWGTAHAATIGALTTSGTNGGADLVFKTSTTGQYAPVERMSIDSGGDVTVSTGNLVIGTSGKGIDFSATADSGGTMTSELLDDYEEGTFTPVWNSTTGSGTVTYTTQTGKYTKIGNVVTAQIDLKTLSIASRTGIVYLSGFPFTSASTFNPGGGVATYGTGLAITAGTTIVAYVDSGAVTATVQNWDNAAGVTGIATSEWTDDGRITMTLVYQAA
jgi:hypothetical protein